MYQEKDLAAKFIGCMRAGDGLRFLGAPLDKEVSPQIVLRCICDSCYQLVQRFYGFQRMCEESFANFEKLLAEVSSKTSYSQREESPTKTIKVALPSPAEINLHTKGEKSIVQVQPVEVSVATSAESIEDIVSVKFKSKPIHR